jgi:putative transposase
LVWGTRYRRHFFKPEVVKKEFISSVYTAIRKFPTLHIETINTDIDHIHIQIEIPPNITVAAVVQKIKIESSIRLKKKFKFIKEMYLDGSIWSVGYFVSTIGLDEAKIKRYIEWQGKKDPGKTIKLGFS